MSPAAVKPAAARRPWAFPVKTRIWWGLAVMTALQAFHFAVEWVQTGGGQFPVWTGLYQGCFMAGMLFLLVPSRHYARTSIAAAEEEN